jgi:hypothetical protein
MIQGLLESSEGKVKIPQFGIAEFGNSCSVSPMIA